MYLAFSALGHTPDPTDDWIQFDICEWLQHGPPKQQTRALRGVGKSYICASYVDWEIYRNPNIAIIVVSGAANLAQDFVGLARKLLDVMDVCTHLAPLKGEDKDGAWQFVSRARTVPKKDPTVWACGITSNKTGHHADIIVCDDIETPENSDTVEKREALLRRVEELEDLLNPGGRIVFLNTPQSHASVYLTLQKRGYAVRVWPCEYPDLTDRGYVEVVAPRILQAVRDKPELVGQPTYPKRFSRALLDDKVARYGPARYALQMKCDTRQADSERYPLKLADFAVMQLNSDVAPRRVVWGTSEAYEGANTDMAFGSDKFYRPIMVDASEWGPYDHAIMFIDPAGGGTSSKDEVAYAVGKVRSGMIYVLETGGLLGGHSEANMRHLSKVAKKHSIKQVLLEENYGKGMFSKLLAPVMGDINGPTELVNIHSPNTQKEKRIIDSLITPLKGHRIVIDEEVAKDSILMAQLTQITYMAGSLRHDDRVEALAALVFALSEYLPTISIEKSLAEESKAEAIRIYELHMSNTQSALRDTKAYPDDKRRKVSVVPSHGSQKYKALALRHRRSK